MTAGTFLQVNASPVPYVIMPFMFEPGRESLFKFTILSDDRDDDGEPDFEFSDILPEEDWIRSTTLDAFHLGGKGNPLSAKYPSVLKGDKPTAGGAYPACETWHLNPQYQVTLASATRSYVFLEALS